MAHTIGYLPDATYMERTAYCVQHYSQDSNDQIVKVLDEVEEILFADQEILSTKKVTFQQVIEKLTTVLRKAEQIYFNFVDQLKMEGRRSSLHNYSISCIVGRQFKVSGFTDKLVETERCPWCSESIVASTTSYRIENLETHQLLQIDERVRHFIARHHHFGTSQRVDPELIISTLNLMPGEDYSTELEIREELVWERVSVVPCPTAHRKWLENHGVQIFYIENAFVGYLARSFDIVLDQKKSGLFDDDSSDEEYIRLPSEANPEPPIYLHVISSKRGADKNIVIRDAIFNYTHLYPGVCVFKRLKKEMVVLSPHDTVEVVRV